VSRAPARIDLAGGTLDIPPLCFFQRNTLTLNLAIDLCAEVRIEADGSGLVRGAEGERGTPISESPLFAHALAYLDLEPTMDVVLTNAIPRASGLGGSSSILVALIGALLAHQGRTVRAEEVLAMVTVLENRLLGKPAGTQDAVAAIYGGLSAIGFETGRVTREGLPLPSFLDRPLYLAYSSEQHHSGMNNWALIQAACDGDRCTLDAFRALNDNAHAMREILAQDNIQDFLSCLREEARLRRALWPGLETAAMRALADSLPDDVTAKVCGAGGGGCMWLYGADPDVARLTRLTEEQGLELLTVGIAPHGSHTS